MNRVMAQLRALLLLALVMAGFAGGNVQSAAAQASGIDPESFESELSGIEIEIGGGDYEIYSAELQTYEHGQGEIVQIASNTGYVQVAFYDDTDTNQETLDIYNEAFSGDVDDFEVLDEGKDAGTVYTYALATYQDADYLYYLSVTEDVVDNVDVLQRIYAPVESFFEDFEEAQDGIEIDGDAFLTDVDATDLEELADGAGQGGEEEPTEEPIEEEPTEDPEGEPTEEAEPVPTIDPAGATVHELEVVPAELVATSEISIVNAQAEAPGYEEVVMASGQGESMIMLRKNAESPEATLDLLLEIFTPEEGTRETLGTDATRSSAWSMDLVDDGTQQYMLFVIVQNDRYQGFHYVEMLFTPVDGMEEQLDTFTNNVQIDGVPLFYEADRETIAWLLGGGEDPDQAEEDTEETEPGEKTDVADEEEEEQEETDDSGEIDLESQGLVSSTEYESPQHGVVVEWDDAVWLIDEEWELSAVSDEETGVDAVILFQAEGNASLMIQLLASDGSTPDDFVEYWGSDEYVTESVHEDAEVLLSDSANDTAAVMFLTYDAEGNELILIQEAVLLDDGETLALVTIYSTPDAVAGAYGDVEDVVSIDSGDAVGTFRASDIEDALP